MGVANLWAELREYRDAYRTLSGSAKSGAAGTGNDDNAQIVEELCGKVLAIDTSVWIFQCSQQMDLKDAIFDEHARVLYIFFHRVMNLLRYGVTPVFVLEGDTPEAKMGRLRQRSLAKGLGGGAVGNRRGGRHDMLGRKVVELLDLMGLPHVDAPGEAEAMAAALTTQGLADGVVTSDVDALMFGATRVYRECRLQIDVPRNNCLEWMDATEAARRCFGIMGGGGCERALQAVACLSGCDYSVSGGRGVGVKTAMEAVQQLTKGRQDDSRVVPELMHNLATGPDPRVTALTKCTGCKNCGHEKHGRQPCPQCGPGPCRPKGEGRGCECEFHRSEPQRKFMRVISRAVGTGPSFSSDCQAALDAFESEIRRATYKAQQLKRETGGTIRWSTRPDVTGVFNLMNPLLGHTSADPDKLIWTYSEVRDKMRPVLLEWDMRQGPEPPVAAREVVEFRPRRIKQVAAKDGGAWAYIIEFDRLPTGSLADKDFDAAQLVSSRHTKGRHVRQTLIHRLWPQLLTQREEEEQAKLVNPKKGRGRAGASTATATATGSLGSPGGISGAPSGSTAATGARRGAAKGAAKGGRAAAAAAAPTQSGASAGSSQLMHRWLGMGGGGGAAAAAAGPTTSVQQPPPGQAQQQLQHQPSRLAQRNGAAAAEAHGRRDDVDNDADDDMDAQMTQRNDGAGASGGPFGGTAAAGGGGAGGSSRDAAPGGAVARKGGAPALVPLWEDEEDGSGAGGSNRYGKPIGGGASYDDDDDLEDVVPTSLDELLAGAGPSQPASQRVGGSGGAAAAAAAAGGGEQQGGVATAWGPAGEGPFRSQPTGPGPGRGASGRGAGGAAAGVAANAFGGMATAADGSRPLQPHMAAGQSVAGQHPVSAAAGGGGGRAGCSVRVEVEVMDLTDSPVPPPRTKGVMTTPASNRVGGRGASRLGPGMRFGGEGEGEGRTTEDPPAAKRHGRIGQRLAGEDDAEDGTDGGEIGEEDGDGEEEDLVVGSAAKPPVSGRGAPAAVMAAAPRYEPGGCGGGAGAEEPHLGRRDDDGGEQQASPREAGDGGGMAEHTTPAARRAKLMRTLFPDRPLPPSPLTPAQPPRKKGREEGPAGRGSDKGSGGTVAPGADAGAGGSDPGGSGGPPLGRGASGQWRDDGDGGGGGNQGRVGEAVGPAQAQGGLVNGALDDLPSAGAIPVGAVRQQQQQRQASVQPDVLGSPPKRQNRGEAGSGNGSGGGGGCPSGLGVGGSGAHAAVDLTLDDSDDEEEEGPGAAKQQQPSAGLTEAAGMRGTAAAGTAGAAAPPVMAAAPVAGEVPRRRAARKQAPVSGGDVDVVDLT